MKGLGVKEWAGDCLSYCPMLGRDAMTKAAYFLKRHWIGGLLTILEGPSMTCMVRIKLAGIGKSLCPDPRQQTEKLRLGLALTFEASKPSPLTHFLQPSHTPNPSQTIHQLGNQTFKYVNLWEHSPSHLHSGSLIQRLSTQMCLCWVSVLTREIQTQEDSFSGTPEWQGHRGQRGRAGDTLHFL